MSTISNSKKLYSLSDIKHIPNSELEQKVFILDGKHIDSEAEINVKETTFYSFKHF